MGHMQYYNSFYMTVNVYQWKLHSHIYFFDSIINHGKDAAASDRYEDSQAGVVTLLHNIIIAGDEQTRAWFAQYLKCMQQKVYIFTFSDGLVFRIFNTLWTYTYIV